MSREEAEWETTLLAMRLDEGMPEGRATVHDVEEMERQGWISRFGGRLALTERGMLVFNEIVLRMTPSGTKPSAERRPRMGRRWKKGRG